MTDSYRSRIGNGGRAVVVGLRPENLRVRATGRRRPGGPQSRYRGRRALGHENIVHGQVGGDFVIATVPPPLSPRVGDQIDFLVELDRLHLFDAETELSLVG